MNDRLGEALKDFLIRTGSDTDKTGFEDLGEVVARKDFLDTDAEMIDRRLSKIDGSKVEGALDRIGKIATTNMPRLARLAAIRSLRDLILGMVTPHLICKEGCSHCCHMAVGISEDEAYRIGRYLGIKPKRVVLNVTRTMQDYQAQYIRVPCPFLENDRCSIYEVRPCACRTNLNLTDDPNRCNVYGPMQTVPNLDWRLYWTAEAFLNGLSGQSYGDIREFYPNGRHPPCKE